MQETQEMWVQPLDREDPLEKEMATHSIFLLENSMERGAWWATAHGVAKELGAIEWLTLSWQSLLFHKSLYESLHWDISI